MAKDSQATGRITLRCPREVHAELLEIAGLLGVDMTALLNQMLNEVRPIYLERARKVTEAHASARLALDEMLLGSHPLVQQMLMMGRNVSVKERLPTLTEIALRHHRPEDPEVKKLVLVAWETLRREDDLRAIDTAQQAIEKKLMDRG